jgi:IS1 family transposase
MASPAERQVLLAPDVVARAAARVAPQREQRWMLSQPRELRRHFVRHVFDHPDMERRQEIWMLTQTDDVRESYIADVLERQHPRPHQEIWMLRQPLAVRESYVYDVILAEGPLSSGRS